MAALEQAFLIPEALRFHVITAFIIYPFSASREDGHVPILPDGQILPFVALHEIIFGL